MVPIVPAPEDSLRPVYWGLYRGVSRLFCSFGFVGVHQSYPNRPMFVPVLLYQGLHSNDFVVLFCLVIFSTGWNHPPLASGPMLKDLWRRPQAIRYHILFSPPSCPISVSVVVATHPYPMNPVIFQVGDSLVLHSHVAKCDGVHH